MTHAWHTFPACVPAERRYVLVACRSKDEEDDARASFVSVGYVRHYSTGPFFVVPRARPFEALAWSDCLGDEWSAPCWAGKQRARGEPESCSC